MNVGVICYTIIVTGTYFRFEDWSTEGKLGVEMGT